MLKRKVVEKCTRGLRFVTVAILLAALFTTAVSAASVTVTNATQFKDTAGNALHAHGGGVIKVGSYYYWFGENRNADNTFYAVSCYRSTDLKNWEFRNHVLRQTSATELNKAYIERPKVIYNAATKKYVMWMHKENGANYSEARAAVAVCDTVDGNYTWQGSFRPLNAHMSRDCTAYVDDDGTGYFISAANENRDLHVYRLNSDYLTINSLVVKLFVGVSREAPAMFKRNGYYYLLTSGCTGWNPNQQQYSYSRSISSGWSSLTNIGNSNCYRSQTTYVLPIQGTQGTTFLYMGDRWGNSFGKTANDSLYVWAPIKFNSDTSLSLYYGDILTVDAAAGTATIPTYYKIQNQKSGKLMEVSGQSTADGGDIVQYTDNGGLNQHWRVADVSGYKKLVNRWSGKVADVDGGSTADGGDVIQWTDNSGTNQQWTITDMGSGWNKITNRKSGKVMDVSGGSTADSGDIVQWTDNGGTNQRWKLTQVQ